MRSLVDRLAVPATTAGITQAGVACAGLLGVLVQVSSLGVTQSPALALTIAAVLQAVCWLVVVFVGNRLQMVRRSSGYRLLLLAGVAGLRGLALLAILGSSEVSRDVTLVITSMIFFLGWTIGLGLLVQGSRDFRVAYAACVADAVESAMTSHVSEELETFTAWLEATDMAEAERRSALEGLERSALSTSDPEIRAGLAQAARDIHEAIDDRVRPASHRMWAEGQSAPPRVHPAQALISALTMWQAPWIAAAVASALAVLLGSVRLGPVAMAVLATGTAAVVAALLLIRLRVTGPGTWVRVLRSALFVAIVPLAAIVLDILGSRVLALPPAPASSIVVALAAGAIALTVSTATGVNAQRAVLIDVVRAQVEEGEWADYGRAVRTARASSEAGIFLHHRVQSHLLGAALRLELAANGQMDPATELETIRERFVLEYPQQSGRTGSESLREVPGDWAGICDVEMIIGVDAVADSRTWDRLDLLVREAVATGVRRAGATWARFEIVAADEGSLRVTFMSNGQGSATSQEGLGTAWVRSYITAAGDRPVPGPSWEAVIPRSL